MDAEGPPRFINAFWTAAQRQGHAIHEISYRACFKPQLPAFFIERLTSPGDTVYDPFMGRGTTPIQAALMGRRPIGADINPLSAMLTRPRTAPPSLDAVRDRLDEIDWTAGETGPDDLLVFYHPDTLRQITALKAWLLQREGSDDLDRADDWIRMIALNRLSGHSSGFFSVYTLPPNQAVGLKSQARINARLSQTPPPRDVPAIILRKSRSLLRQGGPPSVGAGRFLTAPAQHTPEIATGSVDLVVTSPPFLDVVQYAADNWLRCWFAGIEPAAIAIAMHRTVPVWTAFIAGVLGELERVLAPGGHVAFEVGEVRSGTAALEDAVLDALASTALEPLAVMINDQAFTKTANCWGVSNNARGTNTNRIVIARRS